MRWKNKRFHSQSIKALFMIFLSKDLQAKKRKWLI